MRKLLLTALCFLPGLSSEGAAHFVPLGAADGLSSRKVYQMQRDASGYLWFYTTNSLERYDGNEIRHYTLEPASQSGNFISTANSLAADREGRLWVILTNGKLYHYDKMSDSFRLSLDFAELFPAAIVYSALFNPDGTIWLGTSEGAFLWRDGRVERHLVEDRTVFSLFRSPDNLLFFGTDSGLFLLDHASAAAIEGFSGIRLISMCSAPSGELFIGTFADGAFVLDPHTFQSRSLGSFVPRVPIRAIVPEDRGRLLLGTDGEGILVVDPRSGSLIEKYMADDGEGSLCGDTVSDLYADERGRIWVTTSTNGVCFLDRDRPDIEWIRHQAGEPNSLASNHVNILLQDSSGNIWYGTNKGLSKCDAASGRWTSFRLQESDVILALAEDAEGTIWAGGYGTRVFTVDPVSERIRIIENENLTHTFSLLADGGDIWFGGLESSLARYEKSEGAFRYYPVTNVWKIARGPADKLLLASTNGLGMLDKGSGDIGWLPSATAGETDPVWSLAADAENAIWLATDHSGIVCFHPATGESTVYTTEEDGAPEAVISLTADRSGKIWAATENHLYCLDPSIGRPVNMNGFFGIRHGQFNNAASLTLSDGTILIGTAEGALHFNPAQIDMGPPGAIAPELTDFRLLSTGQEETAKILAGRCVNAADKITLRAVQNSFALSYSAIDFVSRSRIRFDYRLEGYEDLLHSSLSSGTAEYVKIPPGRYRFSIRTVDTFTGSPLGERELAIRIRQPIWLSGWAILLYALLTAGAGTMGHLYRRRKAHDKMMRDRVQTFVNFAHDLKTPVTLIKAPLAELSKAADLPEKSGAAIALALRSADRLMGMINSLLDLRNAENDGVQLHLSEYDIHDYIAETLDEFKAAAEQKGIRLSFHIAEGVSEIPFDRIKMDQILHNLLSNAIKYTEKGSIHVTVSLSGKMWKLVVRDTGIGIPPEVRSRIFHGGVRAAHARDLDETGYGIGLMITGQLVRQHQGTISLESEEGSGTAFTLLFPLHYRASGQAAGSSEPEAIEPPPAPGSKETVLVVEDDTDMLQYLKQSLSADFSILTAPDGDAALKAAAESNPALVISDVVMPGMNGYDLCRTMKSSMDTSHIPVILLTAMDDRENIISGLEAGADDYVVKPFDMAVLIVRIRNILNERQRLRSLILQSDREKARADYANRLDKEFMDKVIAVIDEELSNPEFQVNDLCRELAMSRTAFFNKLKSLTGQGPNDFIRIYRLNKAKELLAAGKYTISEVSDRVGFADPKYFSVCFRKQFGVSPSRF